MLFRRLLQLYLGLALYGTSMALMVHANLGLDPWDVFHQGVAAQLGWSFGTVVIVTGALVLLAWIPFKQRPGLGTLSNVVVLGVVADAMLALLPPVPSIFARALLFTAGLLLNAVATAAYIGARFGPGPRDGLMTALVKRTGGSVRLVRTCIEVSVLLLGWVLGGGVGVGTVAYALLIGPLVQPLLPILDATRASTALPDAPVATSRSA
ncbi:YczE/YyaS/YitT family protein [Deinococcus yavapaiensis]|uniref:Putative membrane protein YczE n=1 Tax=Deinococcus yavapaiensis KR-236 TaxID=694435 RepID=A0A318S742_9DEIO|nr:hypothetical protein [Deinococcus yavapaiensis]PYE50551.1 putative membrane protein YczE [Deinococcus yavapaiensis KR-236]